MSLLPRKCFRLGTEQDAICPISASAREPRLTTSTAGELRFNCNYQLTERGAMNTIRGSVKQKAIVRMAATVMVLGCSAGAATVCWGQAESADSYPTRPIRLIVQFPPGDATDLTARLIGQKLTEAWGQ